MTATADAAQVQDDLAQADGEQPWQVFGDVISEFRFGAMAHDIGLFNSKHEDGFDTNYDLFFASPGILESIWSPRPHIGMLINNADGTDFFFAGLAWEFEHDPTGLFFGFSLDGVHNSTGKKRRQHDPDIKALGGHFGFRESVDIGFRWKDTHSLSIFGGHFSNAGIFMPNVGLDTLGVRYGFRF